MYAPNKPVIFKEILFDYSRYPLFYTNTIRTSCTIEDSLLRV
jgi:hypothetical protein